MKNLNRSSQFLSSEQTGGRGIWYMALLSRFKIPRGAARATHIFDGQLSLVIITHIRWSNKSSTQYKPRILAHLSLMATMLSLTHSLRPSVILRPRQQCHADHNPIHHPATESFTSHSPNKSQNGSCQESIPKVLYASSSDRSRKQEIKGRLKRVNIHVREQKMLDWPYR
jgi:hypothetical protein